MEKIYAFVITNLSFLCQVARRAERLSGEQGMVDDIHVDNL